MPGTLLTVEQTDVRNNASVNNNLLTQLAVIHGLSVYKLNVLQIMRHI